MKSSSEVPRYARLAAQEGKKTGLCNGICTITRVAFGAPTRLHALATLVCVVQTRAHKDIVPGIGEISY